MGRFLLKGKLQDTGARCHALCERTRVEHFFNITKHVRAIATRYEMTARNVLAGVHLVCALAWLE
jgi:transposase